MLCRCRCLHVCWRYGYTVRFDGVGDPPPESAFLGHCSQIAVFTREDQGRVLVTFDVVGSLCTSVTFVLKDVFFVCV